MPDLGIVMPVANEEDSIERFLTVLLQVTRTWDTRIYLILDNYSKDRTEEIIRRMAQSEPSIVPVFFPESDGPVSCRLHGFAIALEAGCRYVVEMDSGFSHPPDKLPPIMHALTDENYEVVFMSRFMKGAGIENFPLRRRIISRGGSWLANLVLGTRFSDATSGYQGFQAHVLAAMKLPRFISKGGDYATEMKYYCRRRRYKELPFTYVGSTSNFKMKWVWKALQTLFLLRANEIRVQPDAT
ncbi:MAG: glycosyltransferase [Candidatus Xenobia bacterium]